MKKILEKERGSVTIEAIISLSAFMFAIVTMMTIVNICIVQAKIAYAINTTAKEISQYSYLYALTGINDREGEVAESGRVQTQDLQNVLTKTNEAFNEIQNLGSSTAPQSVNDIDDILSAWDDVKGGVNNVMDAGSSIKSSIENIAKDPKSLMFGIAKIGATETFDLFKSRLIAAPLAKVMCKKHLVDEKDGNVDAYLKKLGVIPNSSGSYIDGLDFSKSTLFPYGTPEIKVSVSYDVKVIPLLPINSKFHFNQSAITRGWFAGDVEFKKTEKEEEQETEKNDTLWTQSTVNERASYIRHLGIMDLEDDGYQRVTKMTDIHGYNPEKNEFAMIASMNPLWSPEGEPALTLDDLDDDALQDAIERLCGKMSSSVDNTKTVTTKVTQNGTTTKTEHHCENASKKIILTIPEDEGLKERIQSVIDKSDTRGVIIELNPAFGKGARETVVQKTDENNDSNENNGG